ncbi:HNH endonuclease [Clostridium sp. UBA5712]|uniref:HNH endonuclease n=1 Tax=Clostridium sp. UBA5712 TaxID=1946368 RepID=UPI0032176EDD
MIKIDFENKKESIEKIFWDWFYKYHLKEFLEVISNDAILQKLIFEDEEKYLFWKNDISKYKKADYKLLKDFFFSVPQKHFEYCEKMKGLQVNSKSKKFFLDRYENLRNSQMPKIIHALDVHSCPYCNRNFIDVYYKGDGLKPNKFNGDIDHYFAKSRYEYLALSIYNLIPSCKTCNQEKGRNIQEKIHFHPYMDSHRIYRFKTNFDLDEDVITIDYLYGLSEKFNIEVFDYIDEINADSIKESVETFHLEDKYKNMISLAQQTIRKAYIYNNGYLKDFANLYSDILNEKEIIKILFDYEEEGFLNKPLSKFKYDLMKEFDVI